MLSSNICFFMVLVIREVVLLCFPFREGEQIALGGIVAFSHEYREKFLIRQIFWMCFWWIGLFLVRLGWQVSEEITEFLREVGWVVESHLIGHVRHVSVRVDVLQHFQCGVQPVFGEHL